MIWLRRVVVGLSVLWVIVLAIVFALRVGFPLELEWMEGGSLQQARRVQQGLPVYGPPSPDFVPFLYPPLYPALLAALGFVVPLGYALGRCVSIAAVIATGVALWRIGRIEDKPVAHRALAVGLFASGYVFTFRWLDLARGDSLFLALVLWGLVLLRESEGSWRRAMLAGVLVALAFWTKQTAAVFVLASGVAGLFVAPRQMWIYAGTIAVIDGGGVLLGQALTDGWLWTWIYEMHQLHAFNHERFRSKTWGMFAHAAPWLVLLVIVLLGSWIEQAIARVRARDFSVNWPAIRGPLYWGVLAAAAMLVSALGYSTQFAEPNAFIPGVCFGAAFLLVALPHGQRSRVEAIGLVLIAIQLGFSLLVEPRYQPIQDRGRAGLRDSYTWQDPWRTIPRAKQREQARELRKQIEALDGARLLALHRPWWPFLAGGSGHVGAMGITDVTPQQRAELEQALRERVEAGEITAVWIEGAVPRWLERALSNWTVKQRRYGKRRVRPLSGWMSEAGMVTPWTGEQLLLVPATPREVPEGAQVLADFEDGSQAGFETVSGFGFGRRSVKSFSRGLPPIGPHGGARLLSSAASGKQLAGIGEVRSPAFVLPEGGAIELLLGTTGRLHHEGSLRAELVSADGRRVPLKLPRTRFDLRRVRWSVPSEWAGVEVRLHLVDEDPRAALFADDIWLWASSTGR